MNITGGNAIFAGKWFELDTALSIHVPANSSEYDRIDSVIAQVDNTLGGRLGQIVYRTGTPSETPAPPSTNTEIGITEYRIANVLMRAGATSPAAGDITDLRGTDECPYIQQIGNAETAWFVLALASGIEGRIRYKRVGKTVFVNGSITSAPAVGDTIGTISTGFRPLWDHIFTTSAINGGAVTNSAVGQDFHNRRGIYPRGFGIFGDRLDKLQHVVHNSVRGRYRWIVHFWLLCSAAAH